MAVYLLTASAFDKFDNSAVGLRRTAVPDPPDINKAKVRIWNLRLDKAVLS